MVSFGRAFQSVLVKVLSSAPELGDGGQLENGQGLLEDAHRLPLDVLLLRLGAGQVPGHLAPLPAGGVAVTPVGVLATPTRGRPFHWTVMFTAPAIQEKKRYIIVCVY